MKIDSRVHVKMPTDLQVVYGVPYRGEPKPKKTIGDLKVGDTTWVQPWSVFVEFNNIIWIHRGFPTNGRKSGDFNIKVERREEGYAIDLTQCKGYRWTPLEQFKITRGDFVSNVCEIKLE